MENSFEDKFRRVIERVILPQYDNIKKYDIEVFHSRDSGTEHIVYSVIYDMKYPTTRKEIMNIKNDTRSMFRFLGPDINQTLQLLFYPRILNP